MGVARHKLAAPKLADRALRSG